MTKTEEVERTLQEARKPLRSSEIAELTGANRNTVRGILGRFRRGGKVKKVNRFLYEYALGKAGTAGRGRKVR